VYIEELIGSDTVNTMPPATLDAFREHGHARASLEEDVAGATRAMDSLQRAGISMTEVTAKLVDDGVKLFADAFVKLLAAIDQRTAAAIPAVVSRQTFRLPDELNSQVQASLDEWQANGKVRRLWARDASLWTGTDENNWLGWLGVTEDERAHSDHLKEIARDVRDAGFTHALLLGMGGSSLCPDVIQRTFGKAEEYPRLLVLDSTDPAQIRAIESKLKLGSTLFIVSSKSGSTLEPNIFKEYFFHRAKQAAGAAEVGKQFIAITDPGSKLQQVAQADRFRRIFFGNPSIGGRYSALSDFGMVPAAIAGVDAARFLERADEMVHACASCVAARENPGVLLGTVLGVLGRSGRDKVTIIASPGIASLGGWLEQLLAESTGKDGKGLVPVDGEEIGPPEVYGQDRLFAYLRLESAPDAKQDAAVAALENSGQPVVRISVPDKYDLGQEFFRWEIATAVAGSILGINAFNQPDVEASKLATKRLTSAYEQSGALPPETPNYVEDGIQFFTDQRNAAALAPNLGETKSAVSYLRAHLNRLKPGDYFAALAYIEMNDLHESLLKSLRHAVRDSKHVATCVGFGPRFLHSTGQAYKGGPNTGVFLQITCQDAADLPVPGQKYTFGVVKAAQARGDFEVLIERQRRALRVYLTGADVSSGLEKLLSAVHKALS
jgi:transaldolase/glucose-6-phosphate isomerase